MYDFDKLHNRIGTGCYKYDALNLYYKRDDLIPLWVADMDFGTAPEITLAMEKRLQHPVYGYNFRLDSYYQAFIDWVQRRHGWSIEKDWICNSPGIVPGINFAVLEFTNPGDKIVIQEPVYTPFSGTVKDHLRTLEINELVNDNGEWRIDFEALDRQLQGAKMFIFCSPHNPIARLWTKEELLQIGRLCKKHNVLIFSDEIHNDLILSDNKHIPIATLEDFADFTISGFSPGKTFNIAGLMSAALIVPNSKLNKRLKNFMFKMHMFAINSFGMVAFEAAYTHGDAWLAELLTYLRNNSELVRQTLTNSLPYLQIAKQEATYLAWLDLRYTGLSCKELNKLLVEKAKVALSLGTEYGASGEGYMRLNFALPKAVLELALNRIVETLKEF
ncbi:MAG: pyridoxal phosphate-dependent aminotransferase [Candidatus Cloacimonetes bacterium]|nr:pyridoxal phosphate-dependent aminotransferase [Candidatus Cloacimonadota bacterium]